MLEAVRRLSPVEEWVHTVLRVPPYPEAPEGSPESVQIFHAGRNYYLWCLLVWFVSCLLVLAALIGIHEVASKVLLRAPEWARVLWHVLELLGALVFAASLVFTYFSQRLNYLLRWYIITDRSLRIRTGAVNMEELTMTFSNIQEIRVSAGPLQNLLKLADVEVHCAGGGGSRGKHGGGGGHIGRFEGLSNANAIRDLIVERLRRYRDSGLGESTTVVTPGPDSEIEAARQVLDEARALRELLTASPSA